MAPPVLVSTAFGEYFTDWPIAVGGAATYALTTCMDTPDYENVTGMSYNSIAMTKLLAQFVATEYRSNFYYGLVNPPLGTYDLVITGRDVNVNMFMLGFTGVNASPLGSYAKQVTTGIGETGMSINLTGVTADDLVVAFAYVSIARGALTSIDGTPAYEPASDNTYKVITKTGIGTVSVGFNFTNADGNGGAVLSGIVLKGNSSVDLTNKCKHTIANG